MHPHQRIAETSSGEILSNSQPTNRATSDILVVQKRWMKSDVMSSWSLEDTQHAIASFSKHSIAHRGRGAETATTLAMEYFALLGQ